MKKNKNEEGHIIGFPCSKSFMLLKGLHSHHIILQGPDPVFNFSTQNRHQLKIARLALDHFTCIIAELQIK